MFRALLITLTLLSTPVIADTQCLKGSFSFASSGTTMTGSAFFSANGDGHMAIIANGRACAVSVSDSDVTTSGDCEIVQNIPGVPTRISDLLQCLLDKVD